MEVNGSSHTFLKHLSKDSFSLADESSILGRKILRPDQLHRFLFQRDWTIRRIRDLYHSLTSHIHLTYLREQHS